MSSCSTNIAAPVFTRGGNQDKETKATVTNRVAKPTVKKHKGSSSYHIVVSGDTLYSISWNYNLDYKEIARWNNIKKPYVIHPKQLIRLTAPLPKKTTVRKAIEKKSDIVKKETKGLKPVKYAQKIDWQWPTTGKLIKSNSPISKKGLDIAGKKGQSIKASASGGVVYSGSGLLGYGKLIIIKHSETYLSAYAHNSVLVVKEGDHIISGQEIAKMGEDSNGQVLLHFEIRKNGNPVNPAKYLPRD